VEPAWRILLTQMENAWHWPGVFHFTKELVFRTQRRMEQLLSQPELPHHVRHVCPVEVPEYLAVPEFE